MDDDQTRMFANESTQDLLEQGRHVLHICENIHEEYG